MNFLISKPQTLSFKSGTLGWNPNLEIFKAPQMISLCNQFEKTWTNILIADQPHLMTHYCMLAIVSLLGADGSQSFYKIYELVAYIKLDRGN